MLQQAVQFEPSRFLVAVLAPGLNVVIPFVDRITYRHDLREIPLDVPSQIRITKDNTQLQVDGILYFQVTDARLASYGSSNYIMAITQLAQTIARLHAHEWVVYAKQPLGGPVQVLEYLGRYTHRVAISNERIVGMDEDSVSFRVRDSAHGNRRRTLRLPAETFIDRFLLHVLPKGFKRIRHYGLLGPASKARKLAQARVALSVAPRDPVVVDSVAAFMCRIERHAWMRCGHCGQGCFVPTAPIAVSKERLLQPRGPA